MNLFIVKTGEYAATTGELQAALANDAMHAQFADGFEARQWESPCASLAFACAHDGPGRAAPRRYVHDDADSIVTYDGLPIDAKRRFSAHVAADIAKNWKHMDADIDGFYTAVRIDKNSLSLEVQTDLFGVYKVYTWTDGKSWLVSNSIAAIDSLVTGLGFDEHATSMFICLAWVPGGFSLIDGIRALGGAQRTLWKDRDGAPIVRPTIEMRDLFRYPSQKPNDGLIDDLSGNLLGVFESLGNDFPNILCPLTGGKDSRLLAVLLHEAGVPARSYTYGNALGADGQIALQVAERLGIEHENILTSTEDLFSNWGTTSSEFVRRGEGLCPVQLITGLVTAGVVDTQSKPVRLWGAGSSICRAPFFEPLEYVQKISLQSVKRRLTRLLVKNHRGLIRPEALVGANHYISDRLDRFDGDGIRLRDMPDLLWMHERGAARSGKNMRATMNHRDTYSPFFARSFAAAAFALSPLQRATEPLHFRLIEKIFPAAHDVPFDKGKWKSQNSYLNLLEELGKSIRFRSKVLIAKRMPGMKPVRPKHMLVRDTMFERAQWLNLIVGDMRERLSDSSNADLWDVIDRKTFMNVTSGNAGDSELALNAVPLFTIATILTYRTERSSRIRNAR